MTNDKIVEYLEQIAPASVERIAQHLNGSDIELTPDEELDLGLARDTAVVMRNDEMLTAAKEVVDQAGGSVVLNELTTALSKKFKLSIPDTITAFKLPKFLKQHGMKMSQVGDRVFIQKGAS